MRSKFDSSWAKMMLSFGRSAYHARTYFRLTCYKLDVVGSIIMRVGVALFDLYKPYFDPASQVEETSYVIAYNIK